MYEFKYIYLKTVIICVVDPDPHSFGRPGSGSVQVMRIRIGNADRIQEHGN
jgi:hypothetical protein